MWYVTQRNALRSQKAVVVRLYLFGVMLWSHLLEEWGWGHKVQAIAACWGRKS